MTEAELQEIEKRAAAAWKGLNDEGGGPSADAYPTVEEDVPALVAEVRRLRAVMRAAIDAETDGSVGPLLEAAL